MGKKLFLFGWFAGLAGAAFGYDHFAVTSGDWNVASNWNPANVPQRPSGTSHAFVGGGRTMHVNGGDTANVWVLHVGTQGGAGTVNMNAGSSMDTQYLRLGRNAFGGVGNGTFVMNGDSITIQSEFAVGYADGGTQTFQHNSGIINTGGASTMVGTLINNAATTATYNIGSGATLNTQTLTIGRGGSSSTLNIAPGANIVSTQARVGWDGNANNAVVNHTGGTWTNNGTWFEIAARSTGTRTYNLSGSGDIDHNGGTGAWFVVGGNSGTATMNLSNNGSLDASGNVAVGNDNGTGTMNINDDSSVKASTFYVGRTNASGTVTQSDNSTVQTGTLNIGGGDSYALEGGTLRVDSIVNAGTFTWGDAVLTTEEVGANQNNGTTDVSSPGFNQVKLGTSLSINSNLATGAGAGNSTLDLNALYINGGVRFDQLAVTGALDLSAAGDSLDMVLNPYLLRPNIGTAIDSGEIPLVTATGGISGSFDTGPTFLQDVLGWSEYTGAWTVGVDDAATTLGKNEYFLEYDALGGAITLHYKIEGTVPEPGTLGLLLGGVILLRSMRKR